MLALLVAALLVAGTPQPTAGPAGAGPPATARALADRLAAAINAHDAKAVDALVYWGTADASSRWLTEAMLKALETEHIVSTKIEPLDADPDPHYTDPDGHVYGASITPRYKLVLEYPRGPDTIENEGSLEIGEKDGAWYLVALARLK